VRRAALLSFVVALVTAPLTVAPPAGAALAAGVFSVRCVLSHTATVDPIVAPGPPGTPSAHEHAFFGSRTTDSDSTAASMRASATSCALSGDTAGYWVPSLYRDGVRIDAILIFAYYRGVKVTPVQPFPDDLRVVAGGDTRTPPAPLRPQLSLSWSCVDKGPYFTQPPTCEKQKIKAHVHFPDCWNGGGTDAADHRSHLAYSAKGGTCPASHPINLPKLSMHVTYNTRNGAGATLSSDGTQPGGTQLHADFWNTWDLPALSFLVDRCLNAKIQCLLMDDTKLAAMGFTG
jgi:hypothetical protein